MSQRNSGYKREADDFYSTPAWVTNALRQFLPPLVRIETIWDPAAGDGSMTRVFETWPGIDAVYGTDIRSGLDFLSVHNPNYEADLIATNPPYHCAEQFIDHALDLALKRQARLVAMLLRTDFSHAVTRQHLFAHCPYYARKINLTSRIRWFEGTKGSPSFNHAWFIWNVAHVGYPTEHFHIRERSSLRKPLEAVAS